MRESYRWEGGRRRPPYLTNSCVDRDGHAAAAAVPLVVAALAALRRAGAAAVPPAWSSLLPILTRFSPSSSSSSFVCAVMALLGFNAVAFRAFLHSLAFRSFSQHKGRRCCFEEDVQVLLANVQIPAWPRRRGRKTKLPIARDGDFQRKINVTQDYRKGRNEEATMVAARALSLVLLFLFRWWRRGCLMCWL